MIDFAYVRLDVICRFNPHVICKNADHGVFICPVQDPRFMRLLDFYFEGPERSDIPGAMDPKAVKNLKQIEIASWFDADFEALDAYGVWKIHGTLRMTQRLCRHFRRAWARYYVRLKPAGQRAPAWLKGYTRWKGVSLGYQKEYGVLERS